MNYAAAIGLLDTVRQMVVSVPAKTPAAIKPTPRMDYPVCVRLERPDPTGDLDSALLDACDHVIKHRKLVPGRALRYAVSLSRYSHPTGEITPWQLNAINGAVFTIECTLADRKWRKEQRRKEKAAANG